MENMEKRDLMAAILLQRMIGNEVRWLGEHKRENNQEKLEELYSETFKDFICGTYFLVDKMLEEGSK